MKQHSRHYMASVGFVQQQRRDTRDRLNLPLDSKPKLKQALEYATVCHMGQKRKYTGADYIVHPIEVAKILIQHKITDERSLMLAVLHDTIEDTCADYEGVAAHFGVQTALDVNSLTITKSMGNRKRRVEKSAELAMARGPVAVAVRIGDIISNMSDVVTHDPSFAATYLPEKKIILDRFKIACRTAELGNLLNTAFEIHGEALNQLALSVLAEENEREADEVEIAAEVQNVVYQKSLDAFTEMAMF